MAANFLGPAASDRRLIAGTVPEAGLAIGLLVAPSALGTGLGRGLLLTLSLVLATLSVFLAALITLV